MTAQVPILLQKIRQDEIEKQILRQGIMAEYDAISLYEQLAAASTNSQIKQILLDIAKEEKTHVGEFQALLLRYDKEQEQELRAGEEEIIEKLRLRN